MSDNEENLHRLEGTSGNAPGGLIIKKKNNPDDFQFAKPSLLGLDKLAAAKRKQTRLISFQTEDNDEDKSSNKSDSSSGKERKYRKPNEETPTYTGGISEQARERMLERLQKKKKKKLRKKEYITQLKKRRNQDLRKMKMTDFTDVTIDEIETEIEDMMTIRGIGIENGIGNPTGGMTGTDMDRKVKGVEIVPGEVTMNLDLRMNHGHQA